MGYNVNFCSSKPVKLTAQKGDKLYNLALKAGLLFENSCGGNGYCGKCSCKISENGNLKSVLACEYEINSDIDVYSDFSDFSFDMKYNKREINIEDIKNLAPKNSFLGKNKLPFEIKKLSFSFGDNGINDIISSIKSQVEGIKYIDTDFIRSLSKINLNAENYLLIFDGYPVAIFEDISDLTFGAVDIGTTSVKLSLISTNQKCVLAEASFLNKQRFFGSDLINRIIASKKYLDKMADLVWNDVFKAFEKMSLELNVKLPSVLLFAGNTVMTHIAQKVEPSNIRRIPSVANSLNFPPFRIKNTLIFAVPSIAGYVGGDFVSGLVFSDILNSENISLFVDLGTNGEIGIGCNEWISVASASAGSAFEGEGIKCGIHACEGAINSFSYEDGKLSFSTIGNGTPNGICAGGLLSLIPLLFKNKLIDRAGHFCNSNKKLILAKREDETEIFIDEDDIANFLRAKSAIHAGIEVLLDNFGLSLDDIDSVFISGNISEYCKISDFCDIGLFPFNDIGKIKSLGNTSLKGCEKMLFSKTYFDLAFKIASEALHTDLSSDLNFMDKWTSALFL